MDESDNSASEIRPEDSEGTNEDGITKDTLVVVRPERASASENTSQTTEDGSCGVTTYGTISWLLAYFKMFTLRLGSDAYSSLQQYFYPNTVLPQHIAQLLAIQRSLNSHREQLLGSCSVNDPTKGISDDYGLSNREPLCVIVEPSSMSLSDHSSTELLIDTRKKRIYPKFRRKNNYIRIVLPENMEDVPTTSKIHRDIRTPEPPVTSDSNDELQVIDINLQSDNAIDVDDNDVDNKSIVMAYLRNQDAIRVEGTLLTSKKKTSLVRGVPKMDTIPESEHTSPVPSAECAAECESGDKEDAPDNLTNIKHCEDLNVNYMDHLGRNALHLACANHASLEAIKELLRAGVDPNVKDNVGMTPLSLCVLRNPCVKIIKLLFDYGAKLLPRGSPADAGLFLHFVLICKPTEEEKEILRILIQHGALINDPNAPGKRQALHLAAMSNNCEMITTLVEMGADITATNHRNETPKEVAISYMCKEAQFCLEELEYRNVFERASFSNKSVEGNENSRKK